MQINKIKIVYLILFILVSPLVSITVSSEDTPIPFWNSNWSYKQDILVPISTSDLNAKFQPIDLKVDFNNPCWAQDEKVHSVRAVCWDGHSWHELDSQIYDLEYNGAENIKSCRIIFLVPEFASGEEKYFIYYDESKKPEPSYVDHLNVEDAYYYFEPISGLSAEGDYYKITEDGFCVYGVGQKGEVFSRSLAQTVVRMKPGVKEFDVVNSDSIVSFGFTYNYGPKDEDQESSDQILVSKEISVNGNLMVEFGVVSQSKDKELRTSNVYRYYYCPTTEKRINVHVKHQVFKECIAQGQENIDGIYGALVSFWSRSNKVKKLQFGEILPYVHIFNENNQIKEYKMPVNPESKDREWIISYKDDCDLGKDAWISYDEGEKGKALGIIFTSNKDIVKYGKNELDGIQVKAAEKEYLDALGTELDYAGVIFGRNSYERGGTHDLSISKDLTVEFDAELYTSEDKGYVGVVEESEIFRNLAKYRNIGGGTDNEDKNIYTLTVIPRLCSRILSFPSFVNLSSISAELYQENELVSIGIVYRPFFSLPKIKFTKLAPGDYVFKIYKKLLNRERKIVAIIPVTIEVDQTIDAICTWQKDIKITAKDQKNIRVANVEIDIYKDDAVVTSYITNASEDLTIGVPFSFSKLYVLKAHYKGFKVYDGTIGRFDKNIDLKLNLYDLKVKVTDELGFRPGVDLSPLLTSSEMNVSTELEPDEITSEKYVFKNLPEAKYNLFVSYGNFFDTIDLDLPYEKEFASIKFTAVFDLSTELLDSRGDIVQDKEVKIDIKRDGKTIYNLASADKSFSLPPGKYTINVKSDNKLIGTKTIELTNNKEIKIITDIKPILPTLVTWIIIIFIIEIFVLIAIKRISLNTFLKLLALSLVILSLFQPWWALNATSTEPIVERTSNMYILPQTMVESIVYNDHANYDLATLPEIFTNFVGTLLLIIVTGIILLCFSFIPNVLLKRRFSIVLISSSIIFMVLVALAFSLGMSKITEISVGCLNGQGQIDFALPTGENVYMQSSWGLGTGFYLCIISAVILVCAGIIDYLKRKNLLNK